MNIASFMYEGQELAIVPAENQEAREGIYKPESWKVETTDDGHEFHLKELPGEVLHLTSRSADRYRFTDYGTSDVEGQNALRDFLSELKYYTWDEEFDKNWDD